MQCQKKHGNSLPEGAFKVLSLEEKKALRSGEHVYVKADCGHFLTVKVNGKPQIWKTRPDAVKIPFKYGLYEYGYLTEKDEVRVSIPAGETSGDPPAQETPSGDLPPHVVSSLRSKLHPSRFTAMSGKMAAIVSFILGENWTSPAIEEMSISSDGFTLARLAGDIGFNEFIGSFQDLADNWKRLLQAAGLSPEERDVANSIFISKLQVSR